MATQIIAAAELLVPDLARGRRVTSQNLRAAMEAPCGGSDAEGAWVWHDAYEACEVAQILFLRKYGPAMRRQASTPVGLLGMLARVAALLPTQTRRSEDSQAFQQFSTPAELGFVAAHAAGITRSDFVLEPSAGTGLLAILTEWTGATLALNELAETRAGVLDILFPGSFVSRHDAAQIDDRLDPKIRPTVVVMNPPFSVGAHVDGKVRDAAMRHLASAFARLADGGCLVAIIGASLSPDAPQWREQFVRLQEGGTVLFSAPISGSVYAAHGTSVETRLTVIDKVAAADPGKFPPCPGLAPDAATLLKWVIRLVPPRQRMAPAAFGISDRAGAVRPSNARSGMSRPRAEKPALP